MGANSLLIVPAGFNPSTGFAHYSSLGLTHTLGTTLTVPAGQGFGGSGSITRSGRLPRDDCGHAGGAINLSGGLTLSGTGTINLGSGDLTTNDLLSGISGGSLYVANHYVGNGGTGTFTQSGGTQCCHQLSYLGNNAGDSGGYSLSGSGQLSASYEYVGCSGTGTFAQSGGIEHGLTRFNAGSSGTYNLSGSGQLSAPGETWATPAQGLSPVGGDQQSLILLYLGYNAAAARPAAPTTSAAAACCRPPSEYVGYAPALLPSLFQQTGGTNTVSLLSIGSGGTYLLAGGALQVNGSLVNQGIFAGSSTPGHAQCQRHLGSLQRHLAEPGQPSR